MRAHVTLAWCLAAAVCVIAPTRLMADWWDDFSDNNFWNDPNFSDGDWTQLDQYDANYGWEADNPQWWVYALMCHPDTFIVDANYGAVRIWCEPHPFIPQFAYCGLAADDGVHSTPESETYWDDTSSHYVLCRAYYPGHPDGPNDPNFDCGKAGIFMHGHPFSQQSLLFMVDFDNKTYEDPCNPGSYKWADHHVYTYHANVQSGIGTDFRNLSRIWIDPNGVRDPNRGLDWSTADPNDTTWLEPPEGGTGIPRHRDPNYDDPRWYGVSIDAWERNGFWILMQFEIDPNYEPGDPNGKWVKGAIWSGDKYAWDGDWLVVGELSGPYWDPDTDPLLFYRSEGRSAVAALSSDPLNWGNGFPADAIYDAFEAREGFFDPNDPRLLDLTISNSHMGTININPDVPDPNDPNTADARLCRYTNGTEIVLIAEPLSGKSLKHWIIWDPNHPGDANHVVTDTNSVLYLTMDADWEVEAAFKCGGGSELVMPLGMVLLALFAGVVVRHRL